MEVGEDGRRGRHAPNLQQNLESHGRGTREVDEVGLELCADAVEAEGVGDAEFWRVWQREAAEPANWADWWRWSLALADVVRRNQLHLHAVCLEILDQLGGRSADAVDGTEGFGREQNALAAQRGGEFELVASGRSVGHGGGGLETRSGCGRKRPVLVRF